MLGNKSPEKEDPPHIEPKRRKVSRVSLAPEKESAGSCVPLEDIELSGIIDRIILKNIFCHEYLEFAEFIPYINLLQGANGSGKSSIVAAIIIGLGGSSKASDRSKNLKSVIKNGKSSASIEIHLKNKGALAYKPELYGEKVVVERKLTLSGASSYKIKAHTGQIVSTKKDDLSRILDWYSFQVDNPVLVLSQERAKTFLSSTDPKMMFDFFMSSTQLKQWSEAFESTKKDVQTATLLVRHKEENLANLEKEVRDTEKKVQAMKALQTKKEGLSILRKEIAWAGVEEDEQLLETLRESKRKTQLSIEKVNQVIAQVEAKGKELRKIAIDRDKDMVELSKQTKDCEAQHKQAYTKFIEAKKRYRGKMNERMNFEKQAFEKDRDVSILKKKLEADNNAATQEWEKKIAELNSAKEKKQAVVLEFEQLLRTEQNHGENINQSIQDREEEYNHYVIEENAIKERLRSLKQHLDSLKGEKDNLTVFGPFMPMLIREIDVMHSRGAFRDKPIGPLGSHIKVKNPEWIHIVENVTFRILPSFLVSCKKDYNTLSSVFARIVPRGTRNPQVIVSSFRDKLHDVSRYETGTDRYFSMWSIIETNSIHVANALLDQLSVETILLVPTGNEANDLLVEESLVPRNCKRAMTLHGDTYIPDPNFKVYSGRGDRRVQFLQVSVEDRIRDLKMNIMSTEAEVKKSINDTQGKRKLLEELNNERTMSLQKKSRINRELKALKQQMEELKNQETPPPPDVYQLQKELEENEAVKREIDERLKALSASIEECDAEVKEAEAALKIAEKESDKIKKLISNHEKNYQKLQQELTQRKKELVAYGMRKEEFQKVLENISEELNGKELTVEGRIKEFLELYGERIKPSKSKKELERNLNALTHALQREEASYGNIAEITSSCHRKIKKYNEIVQELKEQQMFITKMEESLASRSHRLRATKKLMAILLKSAFESKVNLRNLKGAMDIDYKAETLKIMMTKNTGDSNQQLQSLQMMSGGERSFATVSFILSLWEMTTSPVKIMDEFDIFMDVVSRNQCVEMIVQAARKNFQYILVSPLEYRHKSEKLQVLRMPAPERGNNEEGSEEV